MSAGSEMLAEALARGREEVDELLRRHRDPACWRLVQWGYVTAEPAPGLSSAERLGGINATLVRAGDVLIDTVVVGGVWGHWRQAE